MFWRKVFGFVPVPFFVTESMPEDFGAQAKLFFCKIRSKYVEDEGLIAHELTHIEWSYKYVWIIYAIMYSNFKSFRLKAEVAGYKTQLEYTTNVDVLAYRLANFYGLGITQEEAKQLLL